MNKENKLIKNNNKNKADTNKNQINTLPLDIIFWAPEIRLFGCLSDIEFWGIESPL